MLRITIENKPEAAAIKLEGKLAGPWVGELERAWSSMSNDGSEKNILVDIRGVMLIDAEGRNLMKRMCAEGATFKAQGCLIKETVAEIQRECEDSRERS
jgi:hypothetical protein